jgi:heparinase II/III-like protein
MEPRAQGAQAAPVMLARLARFWRRPSGDAAPAAIAVAAEPPPTLDGDLRSSGRTVAEWCAARRRQPVLYSSITSDTVAALRQRDPIRVERTQRAAERVLRHEFDLLGSGPFVPADPDRPPRDGYSPIDWYLDPVRRLRFPRGVPHAQWNLLAMRPQNADVKYPWELGRCQHWATLGQAYLFTGDDRFAIEIARELADFVEANPTGVGVNWTCTMDVGLRAANWAIGLELVRGSAALDESLLTAAYRALFDHGVFIRTNLENTYEVTSNHFLSNLLGLLFLAHVFGDLPQGAEWNGFARASIEQEIGVQVLADGADYESSIPYHRLVAELFLGAMRLTDHCGDALPPSFRSRVRDMVAYLAAVTRPDGLMPQVGDADDGRLHVFEGYGETTPQDARHLIGAAGAIFDEPGWRALGGEAGAWEAAWWGIEPSRLPSVAAAPPPPVVRLFPHAGIAAARTAAGHYLLVTNGIVGTNGFGNHKHNDLLGFEFHHGGTPLFVDAGSYVYTSDADARNRFRGTAYHNTLMVDGVEQNDLRPDWLFRLFETSHAETIAFDERGDVVEYRGRHHGYARLPEPVVHERTFRFAPASGNLAIVDRLIGRGRHDLRWHFHLSPGVLAVQSGTGRVALTAGGRTWTLVAPAGLSIAISPAACSPSYGVAIPCLAIDLLGEVRLAGEGAWEFAVLS